MIPIYRVASRKTHSAGGLEIPAPTKRKTNMQDIDILSGVPKSIPNFKKFIESALPDPKARMEVQKYIGYTMIPDIRYQCAQLWVGDKAYLMADVMEALHNKTAVHVSLLDLNILPESVTGASLIVASGVPDKINCDVLKDAILGEPVRVRTKAKSVSRYINLTAKWILLSRDMPRPDVFKDPHLRSIIRVIEFR